jgi:K+-sensing histidine kinase KdpD
VKPNNEAIYPYDAVSAASGDYEILDGTGATKHGPIMAIINDFRLHTRAASQDGHLTSGLSRPQLAARPNTDKLLMNASSNLFRRRLEAIISHPLSGYAAGVCLVAISVLTAGALEFWFSVSNSSMVFLAAVLLTAVWFGQRVAVTTAIAAFLVYNFYLVEPRFSLQFAGAQDLITILIFVAVALLTGRLAGQAHDARQQAESRAALFASMFNISKTMADRRNPADIALSLAEGVAEILAQTVIYQPAPGNGDAIAGAVRTLGSTRANPPSLGALRSAARAGRGTLLDEVAGGELWRIAGLGDAVDPAGAIAWRPASVPDEGVHGAISVLIELANVTLAKLHLARLQAELAARTANDRFRNALMSSLSHDFRTPLSTILASATSLMDYGATFDDATRRDLLTSIQEEVDRINRFIANIFAMTRLEEGVVQPRLQWVTPAEIVEGAAERFAARRPPFQIAIEIETGDAVVHADPILAEQALTNVLDNALAHATGARRVVIRADGVGDDVRIAVTDDGPGVDPSQVQRIFEKFYRLQPESSSNKGTGLGLAIARGFVEAMKGRIQAESPVEGGSGLRISMFLPAKVLGAMPG